MRHPRVLLALVLAVGVAGTAVALSAREGDALFVVHQQSLTPVAARSLDRLLLTTDDPRPGYAGRARNTRCTRGSSSALGNPWSCLVRYPRPPAVRFHVTVEGNGAIRGSGQPVGAPGRTPLIVSGCCATR